MKLIKTALIAALCIIMAAGAGCSGAFSGNVDVTALPSGQGASTADATPVSDASITAEAATGAFSMTTEDGAFTQDGGVYTVTAAGTYALRGALEGQIVVQAPSDGEVVLELSGTAISCSTDSPIKVLSADKVEISAKKGTQNVINDTRAEKTVDDALQGEGAVSSKADLKLKGSGVLVINAGYNNGISCSKDVTVQKLSLKVTAVNNAIKGKDSVTVKSGAVVAISTKGDGIKTESTDLSKSGKVRGDVSIEGGSVAVYSAGDGIQAAHDFNMLTGAEATEPSVAVYTGSYSAYTANDASASSYKGVKAANSINISSGLISISSYDDGLHADSGDAFEAGGTGTGNITVSGGTVQMAVYSPEGKRGGGRMGPGGHGGWGGQQTVSGADAVHADGVIEITGGVINIDSAYEGLEGNVINISGGYTTVSAVDDAVNATKGASAAAINITGGVLDAAVSPGGDTDGIDSNGTFTQTGGFVITRGPNLEMSAAIDAEEGVTVTGGTIIVLGYGRIMAGSAMKQIDLSLHSQGAHTVNVGGTEYTFTNNYAYGQTLVASDTSVTGS